MGERVVPVFVYSLAHERPLLLDEQHVAIAHRDMVLAVQTRPPHYSKMLYTDPRDAPPAPPAVPLDEACHGQPRKLDAHELRRPLLAALLQTGWGVAPSHVRWSTAHNASVAELLWAVGRTPFGPYVRRL